MRNALKACTIAVSLTLFSAVLHILIYPKFDLSFLAWVALVPFMIALEDMKPLPSLLLGFLLGLIVGSAVGHSVYFMVGEYDISRLWGLFFTVAIVGGYIGMSFAAFSALYSYVSCHVSWRSILYVAVPAIWVTCEFGRTVLLGGLPWEFIGHSQYRFLPLIQIARYTGVYGISFLVVLVNYSLARLLIARHRKSAVGMKQEWSGLLASIVVVLLACSYGAYVLRQPITGETTSDVAVVQGNIPRSEKWKPEFVDKNMNVYLALTEEALASNAKLVIWPETVLGCLMLQDDNRYLPRMRLLNLRNQAEMLVGGHHYSGDAKSYRSYNAAFLVTAPEGIKQTYHKIVRLPFAEYVPDWSFDFLKKRLRFPRDIWTGDQYTVFDSVAGKFSTPICFEIVFPGHARQFVKRGAEFLVNISNDAWYSESALSYQQVSMACFTAVENGVWVVRSDNNGLSGFISPTGAVVELIPFDHAGVLSHPIAGRREITFYTAHGNVFGGLCLAITLLALILSTFRLLLAATSKIRNVAVPDAAR